MKFLIETSFSVPPPSVFSWIEDPDKAMRWQKGVKGGTILHETPDRVGTTFLEELEEDGKTLEMTGRITAYVPERMIAFHLDSKIHTVEVSYTIEPSAGGSLLRIETDIRWKFPMNILMLFMGSKAREGIIAQTQAELAELKKLCESTPA